MDLSLQVGKYDVQKAIGKGATGTVYLARDTFTGREVALKTIEPEVFRDPEFGTVYRSQFQNEASLAGKLRHPHIVAILDAVVQQDSGYIAMEYVEGGDLSKHVSRDKLLPHAAFHGEHTQHEGAQNQEREAESARHRPGRIAEVLGPHRPARAGKKAPEALPHVGALHRGSPQRLPAAS